MKLLGVPAYTKGPDEASGTIIARLTSELLHQCNCSSEIVNLASDAAASNNGHISGNKN